MADPDNTRRAAARTTEEGRAALRDAGTLPPVRFGGPESALVGEALVVLSPSAHRDDERAMAARLGHLLLHYAEAGAFEPPRERDRCAAWSAAVSRREVHAHAVEAAIARRLGTAPVVPSLRELEAAYHARCERQRPR